MKYTVLYDQLVEQDVKDALDWYMQRSPVSTANFLFNLRLAEERICNNPLAFFKIGRTGFRRAVINRFPYCIYYRVEDDKIVILAIIHFSRSNRYKVKRLKK